MKFGEDPLVKLWIAGVSCEKCNTTNWSISNASVNSVLLSKMQSCPHIEFIDWFLYEGNPGI